MKSTTYDAAGYPQSTTDFNDNLITYIYDEDRGLELSHTEASGTSNARTITTSWHSTYRLPTLISTYAGGTATSTPLTTTSFTYDSSGNQLTKTITDPATSSSRTWTYTYDSYGRILTANGPRTDVSDITTYTYYTCTTGYECGQVHTITDAAGHVTTYTTYNASGQPLTITDPNGVVTTLTYDLRQRLTSRSVGSELTSFEYWPTGLLKKITLPDGTYLAYTYDAAHRLTQIQDAAGNQVVYTLDAMGNHTAENVYDPSNALSRTHARVYNSLNQLYQDLNAANTAAVTTTFGYDNNGNQTSVAAPLSRNTANLYDELNRLKQVTDPANGVTQYGYDAHDNLTSVTDPRSLVTSYQYNGLGDLTQQSSPDTGTATNTYDAAGNLKTSTDARSQMATYSYDALNRVTQIQYSDQTQSFTYDQGTNGPGHLTQISDASGSTSLSYTALGRLNTEQHVIGSKTFNVSYGYNAAGQLTSLTTPSGQSITYGYGNNRLTSVAVNGATVVYQVTYAPFGAVTGWHWGNGGLTTRSYDQDGYLSQNSSAGTSTYTFHADGSIASRQDSDAVTPGSLPSGSFTISTSSNRLTGSYSYDAAGHLLTDGTRTFTYNGAGRMATSSSAGLSTTYSDNALGQRVKKTNNNGTTYFVYDPSGHLLGEYDTSGNLIQEIVWLDDVPVASIRTDQGGNTVGIFYVHTDHLNSPTKITRPSDNQIIWRWDHDPYGNGLPNQDPDGNSAIVVFNLRFPGQYYDQETGLFYNYWRDYDPPTGRYPTSDPIGLRGGVNTYAYASGNPINLIDEDGLLGHAPGRSAPQPRVNGSFFGCIGLACATGRFDGQGGTQTSMEMTLGGGFEFCQESKPSSDTSCNKPENKNCGFYDPDCQNKIQPPGIDAPLTRFKGGGGLVFGMSMKRDGTICIRIGVFGGVPMLPSIDLGNFTVAW